MSATYDVLIIGGGIIGAACADALAREGLRVALAERNTIAGGATAAGMGHIVVMDDSEAQFALTRYSQQLWAQLAPELPDAVGYQQRGTLWIAADEDEMTEVMRKHGYYAERGVATEIIDAASLEKLEPNLRKDLAGALLVPGDAVLMPPRAAGFLMERARALGVELLLDLCAESVQNGSGRFTSGISISAGVIINAAGAWAPAITRNIDVRKRKGHLVMTDRRPGFLQHQIIELGYLKSARASNGDSVAFNVQPRSTGEIVIGSSREYGSEDVRVDETVVRRMMKRAFEYMPALAGTVTVQTWAGFRAATSDKLPLIGRSPDDPALFLATGHEGLGITTSLATAALVADQILNRPSLIPLRPVFAQPRSSAGYARLIGSEERANELERRNTRHYNLL